MSGLTISLLAASLLSYQFFKFVRTEWAANQMTEDDLKVGSSFRIPSIIHQTYKSTDVPQKWTRYQSTCKKGSDQYMFWTDDKNQQFIAKHYPWFLKTYNSYPYPIQRADAVRYFLLYHYGGIYVDLDISCGKKISQTLHVPAWIPKTEPFGFSNDVMSSMPKHPFFKQVIEALPSWNIWLITNYPTVMISTGPLFLSIQAYIYNRNHKNNLNYPKLMVLPESWYTRKYFGHHSAGSSWHSTDAYVFKRIYANRLNVLMISVFLVIILVIRKRLRPSTGHSLD